MAKKYGSKREMEKEVGTYSAFKSGSYISKLIKIEVKEKKNYNGQLTPTLCLQFSPYEANARTSTMKDVDGNTIKPLARKLFLDINNITMGFKDNFTLPSRYRSLAAALQNIDPNDEVVGPDELTAESAYNQLQDHLESYLITNVTAYEKNDKWRNKITDFLPVPEDFESDEVVEAQQKDAQQKRSKKKQVEEDQDDEEELEESTEEKPKTKKPLF